MPGKATVEHQSDPPPEARNPDEGGLADEGARGEGESPTGTAQRDRELLTLLAQLVSERGRVSAAEALDLDPRTVATALKRNALSRRVRASLERIRKQGEGEDEEGAPPPTALEERVESLAGELNALRTVVQERDTRSQREHTRDQQQVEGRLARLESLMAQAALSKQPSVEGEPTGPPGGEPAVGGPPLRPAVPKRPPRRQHPELVTQEPAPDDEQVYGAAWPLVDEWRRLWSEHRRPGKGLAWLKREVRILELEVAMLREHGLTLPPATYPQRGLELHSHLGWRLRALANRRRARAWTVVRLWAVRVLTAGLLLGAAASMLLLEAA
ncbi:MAG: hypothetical protein F4Y50_12560 [Dehalococcoidia bacterium]|nr:hypothetical protein [Dehalococcoidia bacterium]